MGGEPRAVVTAAVEAVAGWTAVVSSSPGGGGDAEHLLEKCSICLQHDHTPIGVSAARPQSTSYNNAPHGGARSHFTNLRS